jgi:hypothetical protein
MLVRVMDLQSFDETLDLPDSITVDQLRELIRSNFNYDLSDSAFYHKGAELPADFTLQPHTFSDCNVIVLFNSRIFPQKSYPRVDQAFRFPASRLQEHYFTVDHEEELDVGLLRPAADFRRFAAGASGPADHPSGGITLLEHTRGLPDVQFWAFDHPIDGDDIVPFAFEPIDEANQLAAAELFGEDIDSGLDWSPVEH